MQLTSYTDYAFRTLIALACVAPEKLTVGEISASYGISLNHLLKVVQRLAELGTSAVYTSPLLRAGATAGAIAQRDAHRDRANVQVLDVDHPDRLDNFVQTQHDRTLYI